MPAWLAENLGTIVVSAILIVIFGAIVARLIKNKKEGKSSCSCGCSDCAMREQCHPEKKEK
ncbi:MAG: FeoB-associated Cys-rich membrane protein [Clostridia bacterium]|nr:FeoB-associated Cys-rich membrane protein [Clostridia bacterium]